MATWLVFIILITVINETTYGDRTDTSPDIFKYVASIWYQGIHHCGGAIITNRQILTAAHCIHGAMIRDLRVVVGSSRLKIASLYDWHHVAGVDVMNDYEMCVISEVIGLLCTSHDIGVITLDAPLIFTSTVAPIGPTCTEPDPSSSCYIIQYRSPEQQPSSIHEVDLALYLTPVTVISGERCRRCFPYITENQRCVVSDGGVHDTRPGDSGSPIICNGTLYAINHGGCNDSTSPAIITPIVHYISFIQEVITRRFHNDVITIQIP